AVFPNKGIVIEKGKDYFIIKGYGQSDIRIVGKRIEYENAFWAEMERSKKPNDDSEKIIYKSLDLNNRRIKDVWYPEKVKTYTEKAGDKRRKIVKRLNVNSEEKGVLQ